MSLPGYLGGGGFLGLDSVKTPGLQHGGMPPLPVKIAPQFGGAEEINFNPQQRVSQPTAVPQGTSDDLSEGKWRNAVLSVVPCLNPEGVARALKILDLASTNAHQAKNLEKALFKSTVDECSLMIGKALLSVRILQDELLQELIKIKTLYPKHPQVAQEQPHAGGGTPGGPPSQIPQVFTDADANLNSWWAGQMQAASMGHHVQGSGYEAADSMPLGAEAAGLTDWQEPSRNVAVTQHAMPMQMQSLASPGVVLQNVGASPQPNNQAKATSQNQVANANPKKRREGQVPNDLPPADGKFKEGQQKTVAEILGELSKLDADTIFIVRRINKLGFKAARILRKHFSQYGKLIQVQRTQSTMKHRFGQDCTPYRRPISLGFIQMAHKKDVKAILDLGEEQVIDGFEHCPIVVQKFVVPQKNSKREGFEVGCFLEEEDDDGDVPELQQDIIQESGSSENGKDRHDQSTEAGSGRTISPGDEDGSED